MRRLRLFLAGAVLLLVGGCLSPDKPAQQSGFAGGLSELGRPWPVLVGEFSGPVTVIEHTEKSAVFAVGVGNRTRYRLDYSQRRLTRLAEDPKPHSLSTWGRAKLTGDGDRRSLVLQWPNGRKVLVSEDALARGFAQTDDLTGVAFYENAAAGARLIYYDQVTGRRAVWRSLPEAPSQARLVWSRNGRYLLEETGGKVIVYNRDESFTVGVEDGSEPAFSPTDLHLTFWRPDGRLALLDLRTGYRADDSLPGTRLPPLADHRLVP